VLCHVRDVAAQVPYHEYLCDECPLVPVPSGVVLGADNQTSALLRTAIDRLNNVNQFLFVLQHPVEFVVVTSAEITHHVFVPEEEHDCHGIVKLVHLVEIGDLVEIANVDNSEILDSVGDAVEDFVLAHTVRIPITTEANDNEALFFGHDGLIDVPA